MISERSEPTSSPRLGGGWGVGAVNLRFCFSEFL